MSKLYLTFFLLLTLACTGKKSSKTTATDNAFYFWQTNLGNFDWSNSFFRSLKVRKIYYRFFDVDWNEQAKAPVPVSPLVMSYETVRDCQVIPVVFITNETFKNLSLDESAQLARHVHRKVMAQLSFLLIRNTHGGNFYTNDWWEQNPYQVKSQNFDEQRKYDSLYAVKMKTFTEIQFDCDWTKSTRDKYFAFLEEARKIFKDQLVTSTIRLYQYKYPKEAGLPPVDRGMLMCYNAGDVKDAKTQNSIFDTKEIMSYLKGVEYPIALDYALPIFDWALLYREGKLKNILSAALIMEEYESFVDYKDTRHLVVKDDFVYGHTASSIFIRKGDEIRLEQPDMDQVKKLAAWLSEHRNNQEAVLTLYHLNNHDLKKHSKAIEDIFNSF